MDTIGFLAFVAWHSFDLAHVLYDFQLMKVLEWARVPVPFFYYDFGRAKIYCIDAVTSRCRHRFREQTPSV